MSRPGGGAAGARRGGLARAVHQLQQAATWHRRLLAAGLMGGSVALAISAASPAPPPTVPVVAAARDVAAGTTLSAADLRVRRVPAGLAPTGALQSLAEAEGRVVVSPVRAGESLTDARLVGPGLLQGYAAGVVATPVRIADSAVAQLLHSGDVVDVLAAGAPVGSELAAQADVVATAVQVITVGQSRDGSLGSDGFADGALLLLATTPQTAARLAGAAVSARLSITIHGR